MKTSKFLSLDIRDGLKGVLIAAGTAAITAATDVLNSGSFTFNWKQIGIAALAAGGTYIIKNFLTPAKIVMPAAK